MVAGQTIRVLVATQSEEVYEALEARDGVSYDIALYTGAIRELLPSVQLVIIDYEDIVEYPFSQVEIQEELFAARVYECTGEDFVANPDNFLGGLAVNRPGKMLTLPQTYSLAFVSYSGGTGRTALAVDTALYYASTLTKYAEMAKKRGEAEHQPINSSVMVAELSFGISSLISLTGLDMPCLYQLATDRDTQAQNYKGVDFVPMDYENVRVLAVDLLERYFLRETAAHALSVIDGIWPHSLSSAIAKSIDLWVVVALERPDTIANARKLYDELCAEFESEKVWLLQNQASGETEAVGGTGLTWHIRVPRITRPEEWRGELGRAILSRVFSPVWDDYDKPRKSGLFR